MNEIEEKLKTMLDAYSQAVATRDVQAFLNLYDPAVRVFDAWQTWSYDGEDAWRECIRGWFAGIDRVDVSFEDVRLETAEDFAALTALTTYAAVGADGTRIREMQNRLTWILRSGSGRWRIVHEHTSAPIDFAHSNAILRRVRTP